LFLTNNSSKSAEAYVQKLRRLGVAEPFLNVLTSGQAAGRYVLERFPGRRAYVLGNAFLRDELTRMGVTIDDEHPDYVLIGYDTTLDYPKMTRVCDLVRAGLPYVATHPDFNCPTETGFAPDIGAGADRRGDACGRAGGERKARPDLRSSVRHDRIPVNSFRPRKPGRETCFPERTRL
jgi:ribonucleotide monophosphatase NagD (HAD superfamily)